MRAGPLGMRLFKRPAVVVAGAWTPATPSGLVAFYDISDISTLFKDTAGTTPVTADGDIVARVNDKSSSGFHLTQTSSGARPTYRAGGGKPYLECAGAFGLQTQTSVQIVNASNGTHSAGVAVYFNNNTGTQNPLQSDLGGSARVFQFRNNAGASEIIAFSAAFSSTTDSGPAISATTATTMIEVTTPTTTEMFVNGTGNGSTAMSGLTTIPNLLGLSGTPDGFASGGVDGRVYAAALYNAVLSSGDRASFHTWLAGKM